MRPALVPRAVLFGNPERAQPRISPDGGRLAYLAPRDGVLNVWVGEIGTPEASFRAVTDDGGSGIRNYFWSHDGRRILYMQDRAGNENWRLHDVDLERGDTRDLTPFEGVSAQVIAYERRFPTRLLVGLNRADARLHDVYGLDLSSGELELLLENFGVTGWCADAQLEVRAAVRHRPEGGLDILVAPSDGRGPDDWRTVLSVGPEDELNTRVVGFDGDGRGLYVVSSADAGTSRLLHLDLDGGETAVLAEDPRYDVGAVGLHPDSRELQLVSFIRAHVEHEVHDPSIQPDVDAIAAIQRGDFGIAGRDHADRTWLVVYSVDDGSDSYYAWNRAAQSATFLFHQQPALSSYELSPMESFSFRARDNLEIHGYVTFPVGEPRERLPTVLLVHGGPWGRDVWGYSGDVQWLANRGYLCVQVNFRGSTGYGKDFVNAGDREWAGRMHDDLIDAVEHVAAKGWADPRRVAIMGGSYGGYAALVGATFTPDVFRCAVASVGPSNLKTLLENIPPYWAPIAAQLRRRIGDPETEEDFLWSRSPLSRVDAIRIPVLVAQGANDPRVPQAESEQIVAALRERGIEHEYILLPDEGHTLAKPENRQRVTGAAERFLARHLGGRCEE
ncbi:MAG: S9 family peptidase [Thermoleophilaceae bacterium]